jgi:hypothetical protein
MSVLKMFITTVVITLPMMSRVEAKPPSIDYQWSGYEGSQKQCVQTAKKTMQAMEFTMSSSTAGNQEAVGYQGDYKGVIACLPNKIVVFIVAGPNYKQAELLSKQLKNNF